MTGLTARTFGLKNRGILEQGAYADLVLFDPGTVIDTATFERPESPADGILQVFVNGQRVWHDGAATGARPGKCLRGEKYLTQ